jgi:hypothetical protein
MALNLALRYAGRINGATSGYPYGSIKNESSVGADDGTPVDKDWLNDLQGLLQSLLDAVGAVPTNTPDQVGASQYYDAIVNLISIGTPAASTKFIYSLNNNVSINYSSTDHMKYQDLTNASPINVTMLAPSAPYGDIITIDKAPGSGDITISGGGGITIETIDGGVNTVVVDGQVACLGSKNATTWKLIV